MLQKILIPKKITTVLLGKILKITSTKEEYFLEILPVFALQKKEKFLWLYFKFDYFIFKATASCRQKHHRNIALLGGLKKKIEQMMFGLATGYTTQLILVGIGYKASYEYHSVLTFKLGFSHQIRVIVPKGIKIFCFKNTHLLIKSSSKNLLGNFVLRIQQLKKPDAYKNKGILFKNNKLRKKKFKKK